MAEEAWKSSKVDSERLFEERITQRDREWKAKVDQLESEKLALDLRVGSLSTEAEYLRQDRALKSQITESSEMTQQKLESELKKANWELQDYRAMTNRVMQDLQVQIAAANDTKKLSSDKYEAKLIQADARMNEMNKRYTKTVDNQNEAVNELNSQIRHLKDSLTSLEGQFSQMKWKADDIEAQKVKLIEEHALEKNKLLADIKSLEQKDSVTELQDEATHLKKLVKEYSDDLVDKRSCIKKYQEDVVEATDKLAEAERQRAKLELDCQRRCEEIRRHEHAKSEAIINRLSKSNRVLDAKDKKYDKEARLHHETILSLKKQLNDCNLTLISHGLSVKPNSYICELGAEIPTKEASDTHDLKTQNENLRSIISQMRQQMESFGAPLEKQPSLKSRDNLYVITLEQEVKELKSQLRGLSIKSGQDSVPNIADAMSLVVGENDSVKMLVKSLNETINKLRVEKVELTATTRKQQVETESLKAELKSMKLLPSNQTVALEQAKYELNALKRELETRNSSHGQRIKALEVELAQVKEEAAEYHRSLLIANEENHSLRSELAELRMADARSGSRINYGAQELVIQNLEDEVSIR